MYSRRGKLPSAKMAVKMLFLLHHLLLTRSASQSLTLTLALAPLSFSHASSLSASSLPLCPLLLFPQLDLVSSLTFLCFFMLLQTKLLVSKLTARWRLLKADNPALAFFTLAAGNAACNSNCCSWQGHKRLINKCNMTRIGCCLPLELCGCCDWLLCCACGKFKSTFCCCFYFILCFLFCSARCMKLLSKNLFVALTHAIAINIPGALANDRGR